jgi:nitrogen fixation/metabolism regulation signal transduction histidine kinase
MGFNRYILTIVIRSILIAATALIMVYFALNLNWVFTFVFFCLLFILQIIFLIRYVSKVNRDLANFLIHLKEQNTSINFSSNSLDKVFGGLTKEFEKINAEFKNIENEKIKKENLLNLMLDRVGTGIVIINSRNEIKLHNKAILKILGIDGYISKSELNYKVLELLNKNDELKVGDQNIVNVHVNNITRRILIALSELKEEKESLKIYSFHDIDREMTDYELQSWSGLIKVLSHEIMNTLTPMSTVIDTLNDCMTLDGKVKTNDQLEIKDINDTIKGINILENRVDNLQNFIKKFRQFLDIPVPELKQIVINDLFNDLSGTYKNNDVNIIFKPLPESYSIFADKELIELVLINIIKNAIEANAKEVILNAQKATGQTLIEIQDNAGGIDPAILNKVFLPFYTTKKEGSGIGLSLSRQIMFAHKGEIKIESTEAGTSVKLFF